MTGTLWSRIPASARAELIPVISTAIFVGGGEITAGAIVRASHLTPFGPAPNGVAVSDVAGMLLLLNLAVVVWFAYRNARESLESGRPTAVTAKLVGLGTAFATCGPLVVYGYKSGQYDRIVYALPVILYVFVVPFFLIDRTSNAGLERTPGDGRGVLLYALGAMSLVADALLPAVAAIVGGSLYEAALNDIGAPHSVVGGLLAQAGRTEFWGVSTGVAGIVWIPLVLCTARWIDASGTGTVLRIGRSAMLILAAASLAVFISMAEVLIKDGTLLLRPDFTGVARPILIAAKAVLATSIAAAFSSAFLVARAFDRSGRHPTAAHVASFAAFLIAGALVGGCVVAIRIWLVGTSPSSLALVGLHAGGFAVAYVSGRATLRLLTDVFPALTPVFFGDRRPAVRPPR